jgi:hypothetical protein
MISQEKHAACRQTERDIENAARFIINLKFKRIYNPRENLRPPKFTLALPFITATTLGELAIFLGE